MDLTPVKIEKDDSIGGLSECFTNVLRIQAEDENEGTNKRTSSEHLTIEGSPIASFPKRIDLSETPASMRTLPASPLSSAGFNGQTITHGFKRNVPQDIFVITAGRDEHETGQHQENALRTALLCDPVKGCLHRVPLKERIKWIPDDAVKPAPLADLIRVHDLAYVKHLQIKCKETEELLQNCGLSKSQMPSFYAPKGFLDTDTPLTATSLAASTNFCGAAILAVDAVMQPSKSFGETTTLMLISPQYLCS